MLQQPIPPDAATSDQDAQDDAYFRGILHRLIDTGAAMAEGVHQEAKANAQAAAPGATPIADATIPFDRVARAVRRCIVLAKHLAKPAPVRKAGDAELSRTGKRKQVMRRVEDAIHREAAPYEAEALRVEMLERLDVPEFEDDIGRPVREIIDEICADLGVLGPDSLAVWKRRTPPDIAKLAARAAAGPVSMPDWAGPAWRPNGTGDPTAQASPSEASTAQASTAQTSTAQTSTAQASLFQASLSEALTPRSRGSP